ncbi:ABC transporter substrate-binding protein [Halomicrococcus sp. SG-WS-1]|uniref:ABC transporter substrate-binding protein n=1 Tax=Halomicrococcus sp. SG-WS-1 TaxID=3439057 RepID=UPI003F79E68B
MPPQTKGDWERRKFLKTSGAVGAATLFSGHVGAYGSNDTNTLAQQSDQSGTDLVYATIVAPSSIDPMKSGDELEGIISHTLYDGLAGYSNSFPPEVEPGLAQDWQVSDDGKTYTLTLQDNAQFHNGDPVTAEDVVFSVERMMRMQRGPSWMWDGVLTPDSATAVDETTVELSLQKVYAPFVSTLPWMFVVNRNQVTANEQDGDFGDHGDYGTQWLEQNDAGSGPYSLQNHQTGQRIVMNKHGDWWGQWPDGNTYERVVAQLQMEVSTITGMMNNGQADMTDVWLSVDTYQQLGNNSNISVSNEVTFAPFFVFMNTQVEPLDDINVRKALAYALDYDTALSDVFVGAEKMVGPLPSAMQYSTDDIPSYTQNMEQARQQLQQSDYNPNDISITYTYVSGLTTERNLGLLMQSNYNPLGIEFEVRKAPWTSIVSQSSNIQSSPQMFPLWSLIQYADPDALLYNMWHSSNTNTYNNGSKYENDQVDELLTQARTTLDDQTREQAYTEVQQILAEDAAALFVCNDVSRWAFNNRVNGFTNNGINGYTHQFERYTESQ